MFVDLPHYWPPREPRRQPPHLTPRQEKLIGWILGFNILMLFLSPIAGVTFFDAVLALLKN